MRDQTDFVYCTCSDHPTLSKLHCGIATVMEVNHLEILMKINYVKTNWKLSLCAETCGEEGYEGQGWQQDCKVSAVQEPHRFSVAGQQACDRSSHQQQSNSRGAGIQETVRWIQHCSEMSPINHAVTLYNNNMGGVDNNDQLRGYYHVYSTAHENSTSHLGMIYCGFCLM